MLKDKNEQFTINTSKSISFSEYNQYLLQINQLSEIIKERYDWKKEKQKELEKKYPPNPPNDVCRNALLEGILIENSFGPKPGTINELFKTEYETLFVWTHDKDEYSSIVIEVNLKVKELHFWKNLGSVIWLAIQWSDRFEEMSKSWLKYKWIYYFEHGKKLNEQIIGNLGQFEDWYLKRGKIIKVTDIANLASEIELMLYDDVAYTAMMLLYSSFGQNDVYLTCDRNYYSEYLYKEPEIWEHASMISNMEIAIVQACRSVEGILGEPPNSKKLGAVLKHKEKWKKLTGVDPDRIFDKAGISYWEFYYEIFFDLRNTSAHSYGNVNYKLEKSRTIQAQCFAVDIVYGYLYEHMLELEAAKRKLGFNMELLKNVKEEFDTKLTK